MPGIAPFRALLYAPRLRSELDRLVAPPYDVQSEEERTRRGLRHEHGIVHLDLPRPESGGDPYADAAHRLESWVREGVLVRDAEPAFYLCEQRYRWSGRETIRRGFFARLNLEPRGGAGVIRHERTFEAPRLDRTRLLSATRTHLSAIFLLHPDPGGELSRFLAEAMEAPTLEEVQNDDGMPCRVVRLSARDGIEFLTRRLRDSWTMIADGHHRYESALAYRDERRARGHRDAEHVLAYLCSLEDPGLTISPIHRLVHSLPAFDPESFRQRLSPLFDLVPMATAEDMGRHLSSRAGRPGIFGLAFAAGGLWSAEWKDGKGLDRPEMAEIPETLRRLDVVLLHRLILEGCLGIAAEAQARQSNLEYVKDARDLMERVSSGRAQLGVQMNPTRMEQVIAVTRGGFLLPQKSTYFYPKVLTGLVLDPLD